MITFARPAVDARACVALALLLATLGCSSDDDAARDGGAGGGSGHGDHDGGASGAHAGTRGGAGTDGGAGGAAGNHAGDGGNAGNGGHAGNAGTDAGDGGTDDLDGGSDASTQSARCEGPLMITSDQELAELLGERCRIVTGALRITQTDDATSLEGLVVERIEGDLTIAANAKLRTLTGLEHLTRVDGNLSIVNNAALDSLDPLPDWAPGVVAGTISIFQNGNLPQCAVDALDERLTAACDNCGGNDAAGVCE